MPRLPRLDLPGHYSHVIVRGVEQRPIFRSPIDRAGFLSRLAKGLRETGAQCFAWALMTNHLHLLLLSGARGLFSLMHPLLTGYVGEFNRRYKRVGHLVQNRYKSILCQTDRYFDELIRYIHLNPVRAGIIGTIEELRFYPWTGHPGLMGTASLDWQAVDPVLARFGPSVSAARRGYEQFLLEGWNEGERDDFEGQSLHPNEHVTACDTRILGDEDFVQEIWKEAERLDARRWTMAGNPWNPDLLAKLTAGLCQIDAALIFSRSRQRDVAKARALYAYAATEFLQIKNRDLENRLQMNSSGVSQARRRGRELAQEYDFQALLRAPPNLWQ